MVNHKYLYYDNEPLIGCLDSHDSLVVFIDYIYTGYFSTGKKSINRALADKEFKW